MALTQQDLQAIGQVIDQKLQASNENLRGEIQAAKQEILAQMAKDREDMAEFFQKTWEMMEPTNAELNERVTALEERAGIASKN